METVLVTSGVVVILIYCFVISGYGNALRSYNYEKPSIDPENPFKVSLIIPVRNEIDRLPDLIADLRDQDYPRANYEVILVDDHSEDGSKEFLQEACRSNKNFRFASLDGQYSGKKKAINLGCSMAAYHWIIQTDADCRLEPGFIRGHASLASSGEHVLITGPVLTLPEYGIWNKFEAIEMLSLTATGMATFLRGSQVICSGANLSYSRDFYEEVKAVLLAIPSVSGDDMFLLIQAKKTGKKMAYLFTPGTLVRTAPAGSIGSFIKQRIRWGSKVRHYSDAGLLTLSLLVWLANAVLLFFTVAAFLYPNIIPVLLFLWVTKSSIEFVFLHQATRVFRCRKLLYVFPVAAFFYYFYITVAGALSMAGRFSWKGRIYGANRNS